MQQFYFSKFNANYNKEEAKQRRKKKQIEKNEKQYKNHIIYYPYPYGSSTYTCRYTAGTL